MGTVAVDVQGVSKRFRLHHERYTSLKERVIHAGRSPHEDLWALRDISFDVGEGETVGILGRNGSGKSTLLKCICGVLQPTSGRVVVRGKLAGLLELGAGFQQELSGRENVYLNGSMLGMSKAEVDRVFDDVVAFAELDHFIDNQVKFYSSGMYVRLGFAVAVNVDPDILVVDEVLAVGDERFQRKCMERIKRFQSEGRTILFVSHSPDQVRSICDRAVVLSDGSMIGMGAPGEAVRIFREHLLEVDGDSSLGASTSSPMVAPESLLGAGGERAASVGARSTLAGGPGSGPAGGALEHAERPVRLDVVRVQYPGVGERPYLLSGQPLAVQVGFDALEPVEGIVFTLEVRDAEGSAFIRTDTSILGEHFDIARGPGMMEFVFESFPLLDGVYDVVVGIQSRFGGVLFDWREPACAVEVMNPGRATGLISIPTSATLLYGGLPGAPGGPVEADGAAVPSAPAGGAR
ncbi:MAG TPA: ABC transporter ATP-binding protein [Acidimicrobiales bacterium]